MKPQTFLYRIATVLLAMIDLLLVDALIVGALPWFAALPFLAVSLLATLRAYRLSQRRARRHVSGPPAPNPTRAVARRRSAPAPRTAVVREAGNTKAA